MTENMDPNSWKYRIAEQIVTSYKKDCVMSQHIFEKVIVKELLWHATTMIKERKVNTKGELGDEAMINIKIVGQRYWSKNAIKEYTKANPPGKKNWKTVTTGTLIHEHAVPRKMIQDKIVEILTIDQKSNGTDMIRDIYEVISTYSKSVIITKEEDKNITKDNKKAFTFDGKLTEVINKEFKEEFKEDGKGFIEFMEKNRYSSKKSVQDGKIEIIDLHDYLYLIKKDKTVPYDKEFKELMHEIQKKI
tara:strand:+ start:136 stop:876 length:741 start_codon:yes stop_codon:yes gene_type:complete